MAKTGLAPVKEVRTQGIVEALERRAADCLASCDYNNYVIFNGLAVVAGDLKTRARAALPTLTADDAELLRGLAKAF